MTLTSLQGCLRARERSLERTIFNMKQPAQNRSDFNETLEKLEGRLAEVKNTLDMLKEVAV